MSTIHKGPVIDGQCRCCGATKRCRIVNIEYDWQGQKEIYSDMFVDCFGLVLSQLDREAEKRLICATCVTRLRDAKAFREQALNSEKQLLKTMINVPDKDVQVKENELEIVIEPIEEPYSSEEELDVENFSSDEHDQSDYGDRIPKRPAQPEPEPSKSQPKMVTSDDDEEYVPSKPKKSFIEDKQKLYKNTITVVENSYVCPFATMYSDYLCVYCRKAFTDPLKLREHTLEHDPRTFKNIHQFNKFAYQNKYAQVDVMRVDCRLCPARIKDVDTLKNHLQKVHKKSINPVTNEFLKFKLTLATLTCIECNTSNFKCFQILKKHMAGHFGTFTCDVCGSRHFEERSLFDHRKSHQKSGKMYPCNECGKTYTTRYAMYLHDAKIHKKEAVVSCSQCDAVFFTPELRNTHLIEKHGKPIIFPCEICDKAYHSRQSLRVHIMRSHLKVMKHPCDMCDKMFFTPSKLKAHLSSHKEKNYSCNDCGKLYKRLSGFKEHLKCHSVANPETVQGDNNNKEQIYQSVDNNYKEQINQSVDNNYKEQIYQNVDNNYKKQIYQSVDNNYKEQIYQSVDNNYKEQIYQNVDNNYKKQIYQSVDNNYKEQIYQSVDNNYKEQYQSVDNNYKEQYQSVDNNYKEQYQSVDNNYKEQYQSVDNNYKEQYQSVDNNYKEQYQSVDNNYKEQYQSVDNNYKEQYQSVDNNYKEQYQSVDNNVAYSSQIIQHESIEMEDSTQIEHRSLCIL